MKTKTFTPSFFLAHKDMVIKITTRTVIGRSKGDVVLEDDSLLSGTHCELKPTVTDLYIKDLNSTNGVIVNDQKIAAGHEHKLNLLDNVKIGNTTYIVLNDEKEVKKIAPPLNKRKYPRPENLYTLKNVLNFYAASAGFKYTYVTMIFLAMVTTFLNMKLDVVIPEHLEFMRKIYSEQIIVSGLELIFIVWFVSFLHSFGMVLFFNRNPVRKIAGLVIYFLILFKAGDFLYGPMGGFKKYMVEREKISTSQKDSRAIVQLRSIVERQESLKKSFELIRYKLNKDQRAILTKDYDENMAKLEKEIAKLNPNKN